MSKVNDALGTHPSSFISQFKVVFLWPFHPELSAPRETLLHSHLLFCVEMPQSYTLNAGRLP